MDRTVHLETPAPKNGVSESLDRSQDRESLDTLQAPIDRWHSSARVLDLDWPRMRSPTIYPSTYPSLSPQLSLD